MRLHEATGKAANPDKPKWLPDYERITAGSPFTTDGLTDREIEEHTKPTFAPVQSGQIKDGYVRRPDPADIYPNGERWHQVSDGTGAIWWETAAFTTRCRMWQFARKPNTSERLVDAGFEPERRKDLM